MAQFMKREPPYFGASNDRIKDVSGVLSMDEAAADIGKDETLMAGRALQLPEL